MATAEEFFGISRPNLSSELDDFYKRAEAALVAANPNLAGELKFRSALPLDQLDFRTRTQLISDYRNIIGLDPALNHLGQLRNSPIPDAIRDAAGISSEHGVKQTVANIYSGLHTTVSPQSRNPYGRLPGETSGSLLSDIYSRINIQFKSKLQLDRAGIISDTGVGAGPSSHFVMGVNSIPSRQILDRPTYKPGTLAGKSIMVYDIETAGLAKGSIREVAYSVRDAAGKTTPDRLLFTPAEFNRGIVAVDGRAASLTDFISKKFKIKPPAVHGGEEFAKGMEPFLNQILKSDYIVGHNISQFDNEQVFVGLSRTRRYKTDKKFQKLVDDAFEKTKTSTIDTLSLVRQMPGLSDIRTARPIAAKGSSELFSISNLLIQTDLADRIGLERLRELMGTQGLHSAEVDTAITSAILDAADDGGLKLGGSLHGDKVSGLAADLRRSIVDSAAITPFTNIQSVDQLTDDVLRRLVDNYRTEGPLRVKSGSELEKLIRSDPEEAYRKLRSKELAPTSIKLTPLEQQILSERNIAGGIDDVAIDSGQTLRRMGLMGPSTMPNAHVQSAARQAGIAFSGLSSEERGLAYQISGATSNLKTLTGRELSAAGFATDSLVSRFDLFDPNRVQYLTRTGRASMPLSLLQGAGVFGEKEMLSLSIVDPTADSPRGAVNVVKSLNKNQQTKLKAHLGALHEGEDIDIAKALGFADIEDVGAQSAVNKFREAMEGGLTERIDKRGVSVAQLFDGDHDRASTTIGDILRKFFNVEGQLHDKDLGKVGLPVMDVDADRGILRIAGAVWRPGLLGSELEDVYQAARKTAVAYGQALNMDTAERIQAKLRAKTGASVDNVSKAYARASAVIPHLGKGILGMAAVGAAAVLFNKHQENKVLDETLRFQGYENSVGGQYAVNQQIQQRIDSGYEGYSQLMDPLATASITNNLNNGRTAHTDYSWDRNNSIYGGAL